MVKALACLVFVGLASFSVLAREVKPDNPFFVTEVCLFKAALKTRETLKITPIVIDAKNSFDSRYIPFLWLLFADTGDLAQLWEALREKAVTSLADLATIRGFRSPKALFKIVVFFKFPDEATAGPKLLKLDVPSWWGLFRVKALIE